MSTKRERLLDWIRNGDAEDIPVLLGLSNFEIASAKLGKDQGEVTWDEAIAVAEETGTHLLACIGMPLPFDAIEFVDDIRMEKRWETLDDGTPRETTCITTPEGMLTEIKEFPSDKGECHREMLVKSIQDVPAFSFLIRKTTEAILKNIAIRKKIKKIYAAVKDQVKERFPIMLWPFISAVELTSALYIDQANAFFFLFDQQELMEELMDCNWESTKIWLEMGDELDVDIYGYAINGYEWLSPDIYERYMIPQAKRMNDIITSQGRLSWVHTCGKMKKIAEVGMYQQMDINVLESLSMPPTGDIEDMRETRSQIGPDIVTRGGINCELLYDSDLKKLRERAEYILDSVEGYKHMLGDTNPSYPSYPWANIQVVLDAVRDRGSLFE